MKHLFLLFLTTISLSINAQKIDLTKVNIVKKGVGLANYPIDITKLSKILADFGNNNYIQRDFKFIRSEIEELPTLLEVKYKDFGISFYYLSNDSTQTIRAVKFYKPFKAETEKGIVLNESKIGEVLKAYENSKILMTNNPPEEVTIDKFKNRGISFTSKLSGYGKDEFPPITIIKNQTVNEIYISNYQDKILLD